MVVLKQQDRARMVVDRLKVHLGKSQAEIGQMVGYTSQSAFSQVLNGKKEFPKVLIERICALDPSINPDFLTGESDEMFLNGEETPSFAPESLRTERPGTSSTQPVKAAKSTGIFVPAELAQMVTDLSATVREQQRIIGSLVDTWIKDKGGRQ